MITLGFLISCLWLFGIYKFYGRWMERQMDVSDARLTPAHTERDGIDFEPAPDMIVFGHHFTSIVGAGPIVGPIAAAAAFGWLPTYLWIILGAALIGGVQDYVSMIASLRHKGCTLAQIGRANMGPVTYRLFLLYLFLVLMYVIIVFLDMTAETFAPLVNTATEAGAAAIRVGGVVTTASLFYIILAVLFGYSLYRLKIPLWKATCIALPLVFGGLWLGHLFPLQATLVPSLFGSPKYFWSAMLILYCLTASVLPVWILLQPRDYLSSFLLYACMIGGGIGLLGSSLMGGGVPVEWPMFTGWVSPADGSLYPVLCVMVACGAVSGFHALMASGTTSKQLNKESSARRVGLGAMLVEAGLALLALATIMTLKDTQGMTPPRIFAIGLERFLRPFGLSEGFVITFTMLAISTFVLTTLDTCTRLGRLVLQEMTGIPSKKAWQRFLTTVLVLLPPMLMVFREIPSATGVMMPAWRAIWPAFGATNQLMGATALLVVYGWLRNQGKRAWFVLFPMIFMFITTLSALLQIIWRNLTRQGSMLVVVFSTILVSLAIWVLADMLLHFARQKRDKQSA